MKYFLKVLSWSATDYSFLVNNTNGHTTDDYRYYVFEDEEDYKKMVDYLQNND